jgi:ubiquinone/menaquinone biosynthesis C-methylase UbiE
MTSATDKKVTTDNYNFAAKKYSDDFSKLGVNENIGKVFTYVTKPNPKVVEIGCGDGKDAIEITKRTNDYIGIDISEEFIKIAKSKLPSTKLILADFEEFEFESGIDVFYASAVILHSDKESVSRLLDKITDLLNVNGVVFIASKYGEYERKEIVVQDMVKINFLYTPESIGAMLKPNMEIVWKENYEIVNQQWFKMIIQKKF